MSDRVAGFPIVLGNMSPERVAAVEAITGGLHLALAGAELSQALDGLMSVWLSLSVGFLGIDATLALAREVVGNVEGLRALAHPEGRA